jgi:hypothetical protein
LPAAAFQAALWLRLRRIVGQDGIQDGILRPIWQSALLASQLSAARDVPTGDRLSTHLDTTRGNARATLKWQGFLLRALIGL